MNMIISVLIIGSVWPEPNSSAAGGRMIQLIQLFKENGWQITFATAAQESEFIFDLKKSNIITQPITLNSSSFDLFVKELNPSIVLFDRFMVEEQFGWRVAEQCPNALRILDTEDLHCLRIARQTAWKEKREFLPQDLLTEPLAKREIASVLRCDISLIISEYEMDLLHTLFNVDTSLLYYLPLFVASLDSNDLDSLPAFEERTDFIFIGNFLHEPNWNAVQYLKDTIWPLIRKELPLAKLNIYGAYASQKANQMHNPKENFYILGRAEVAKKVISQAKVLLAPLRFGAGIKGKLLESMQYGTPSVTTKIGAEAMSGNLPWNGFIVTNPELFASNAVELYRNELLWKEAQNNGISIVNSRFLKAAFSEEFINKLKHVMLHLKKHRVQNFLGAMLWHHSLTSTKYLSRWIEEKNK
jgi:glycosyltransferase involved in cell wall biosynthesis